MRNNISWLKSDLWESSSDFDKHRRPVQKMIERWRPLNFPPSNLAAAHLAGFMGKELTSGRLPRYPSSVWKLIPSAVSKPRDPLAGG